MVNRRSLGWEDLLDILDLDMLETYLWEAADLLRGSINAFDYKNYIFGILFLKRVKDRFEEIAEWHDIPRRSSRMTATSMKNFKFPSALVRTALARRRTTSARC
ncbi:type I restriction-modification system subunit M N-terminal domain-containing protein [Halorussus pelagicus]|uniref:type I restriction-modification system subunit M N-terminal domain-containing protein n=1 Tax=Halorussus pelagicus TaxID=2505977 RepID=UPI001FB61A6B|nr:type I restriction-modification system subunit M N-terminal domain-containing protein [Halorussus pelagicus]